MEKEKRRRYALRPRPPKKQEEEEEEEEETPPTPPPKKKRKLVRWKDEEDYATATSSSSSSLLLLANVVLETHVEDLSDKLLLSLEGSRKLSETKLLHLLEQDMRQYLKEKQMALREKQEYLF